MADLLGADWAGFVWDVATVLIGPAFVVCLVALVVNWVYELFGF